MPKIPAMKSLLPRSEGLKLLSSLLPDPKLAAQVLDYWVKRRNEEGGPLLARLWFEQPWKVRTAAAAASALHPGRAQGHAAGATPVQHPGVLLPVACLFLMLCIRPGPTTYNQLSH